MTPFAHLDKSASTRLSAEEVRQRRKNFKLAMGGLAGALPGAVIGAASAAEAPTSMGGTDQKSVLLRALVGALIGGGVGTGVAAIGNKVNDYLDLDPIVPTVGVEQRRMEKKAFGSLVRFGKGFARTPGTFASLLSGHGLPSFARELGTAGKVGEVAGIGATTLGIPMALQRVFGTPPPAHLLEPRRLKPGERPGRGITGDWSTAGSKDALQPGQRKIVNAIKNNEVVDAIVPDLDTLPSGFQQNKLLQLLRGPQ